MWKKSRTTIDMAYLRFLESQYLNDDFADVHFIIDADVKTVKIPAHKVILAAGSSALAKQFMESIDLKKIEITNTTVAEFKEFLFAFYSPYPEKYFTVVNATKVLTLAKTFNVDHCITATERFLLKNLSANEMCFGYSMAMEFQLAELKAHCEKQINEKKHDAFMSSAFYGCNEDVIYDILNNITVNRRDEIRMIFEACMKWAEKKCILLSLDSSNMKVLRDIFGKCFDVIYSIAAKDGEFLSQARNHYEGLFDNDEEKQDLWSTCIPYSNIDQNETDEMLEFNEKISPSQTSHVTEDSSTLFDSDSDFDINNNEMPEVLEFSRFSETTLSPQTCHANAPILIEFQSTKQIKLNGIALATMSGKPNGKLTISMRSDGEETILLEQHISSKVKCDAKNYVAIENVVMEPYKDYVIKTQFLKDCVYRSSRRIAHVFRANDFMVSFRTISQHRDIYSHFFFTEFL